VLQFREDERDERRRIGGGACGVLGENGGVVGYACTGCCQYAAVKTQREGRTRAEALQRTRTPFWIFASYRGGRKCSGGKRKAL
jgi:hypothetical protein